MLSNKRQQFAARTLAKLREAAERCLHGAKYCLTVAPVRDQTGHLGLKLRSEDAGKLHAQNFTSEILSMLPTGFKVH